MVTRTHDRTRDHTRRVRTFPDHVAFIATIEIEPTSFLQANSKPEWRHAMASEMNALTQNNTWTLVSSHPNQQIIGCKWVYKIKR
jgi:CelD/BcsL family acetyltransferase involved in cellulose biosynthesis